LVDARQLGLLIAIDLFLRFLSRLVLRFLRSVISFSQPFVGIEDCKSSDCGGGKMAVNGFSSLEAVLLALEDGEKQLVGNLREAVAIESVSNDPERYPECVKMSKYLFERIRALGGQARKRYQMRELLTVRAEAGFRFHL